MMKTDGLLLRGCTENRLSPLKNLKFLIRISHEEAFIVLLPATGVGAVKVAENCLAKVEALKIVNEASSIAEVVTVSIGVASVDPQVDQDFSTLIRSADEALYRAKSQGRNRIVYAGNG